MTGDDWHDDRLRRDRDVRLRRPAALPRPARRAAARRLVHDLAQRRRPTPSTVKLPENDWVHSGEVVLSTDPDCRSAPRSVRQAWSRRPVGRRAPAGQAAARHPAGDASGASCAAVAARRRAVSRSAAWPARIRATITRGGPAICSSITSTGVRVIGTMADARAAQRGHREATLRPRSAVLGPRRGVRSRLDDLDCPKTSRARDEVNATGATAVASWSPADCLSAVRSVESTPRHRDELVSVGRHGLRVEHHDAVRRSARPRRAAVDPTVSTRAAPQACPTPPAQHRSPRWSITIAGRCSRSQQSPRADRAGGRPDAALTIATRARATCQAQGRATRPSSAGLASSSCEGSDPHRVAERRRCGRARRRRRTGAGRLVGLGRRAAGVDGRVDERRPRRRPRPCTTWTSTSSGASSPSDDEGAHGQRRADLGRVADAAALDVLDAHPRPAVADLLLPGRQLARRRS